MFDTHEDLALANQQIRHAEHLIAIHQRVIDRLVALHQSTRLADRLMEKMQAGLAARLRHRDQIETQLTGPIEVDSYSVVETV